MVHDQKVQHGTLQGVVPDQDVQPLMVKPGNPVEQPDIPVVQLGNPGVLHWGEPGVEPHTPGKLVEEAGLRHQRDEAPDGAHLGTRLGGLVDHRGTPVGEGSTGEEKR